MCAARAPIIVNVSEAGTAIASSLAAHARQAGAAAILASVPYYWTPPQSMLVEHFAAIGGAGGLPFFVYNSPGEMSEVAFASKSVVDLLGRLPNFAGLIDASLDWQYMIEVVTVARAVRPDFQFVSGTEYMISAERDRRHRIGFVAGNRGAASGGRALRHLPRREVSGRAPGAGRRRDPLSRLP